MVSLRVDVPVERLDATRSGEGAELLESAAAGIAQDQIVVA
jgi:hypothetical protein